VNTYYRIEPAGTQFIVIDPAGEKVVHMQMFGLDRETAGTIQSDISLDSCWIRLNGNMEPNENFKIQVRCGSSVPQALVLSSASA